MATFRVSSRKQAGGSCAADNARHVKIAAGKQSRANDLFAIGDKLFMAEIRPHRATYLDHGDTHGLELVPGAEDRGCHWLVRSPFEESSGQRLMPTHVNSTTTEVPEVRRQWSADGGRLYGIYSDVTDGHSHIPR